MLKKELQEKIAIYQQMFPQLAKEIVKKYEDDFTIRFTHNSTAIEGNTLSLAETKLLLEDAISVGGKDLREVYEIVNHKKAFSYMRKQVAAKNILNDNIIKNLHMMLMENITSGGFYRDVQVRITGAGHTPPSPEKMYIQMKNFLIDLEIKSGPSENPIELAAWTHAEFVKIHPFVDGNGRTSRMIMNYQLLSHFLPPVNILKEDRQEYYKVLDAYGTEKDLLPFYEFIERLEERELDMYMELWK